VEFFKINHLSTKNYKTRNHVSDTFKFLIGENKFPKHVIPILTLIGFFAVPLLASAQSVTSQYSGQDSFAENHQLWDRTADVQALQEFLNSQGFLVQSTGPGSPGEETTLFGLHTYHALLRYQEANNLPATGYFGPTTRAEVDSYLATGNASTNTTSSNNTAAPITYAPPVVPTPVTPPVYVAPVTAPVIPGPTCAISASPVTISSPGNATITWSSTNAATANLEGIGPVSINGSQNVSPITNTSYVLTVTNSSGTTASCNTTVSVTVSSVNRDTTAPSVTLVPPASNSTSGTSTTLTAIASDNVAVANVQFKLDNTNIGLPILSSPYTTTLNTAALSNGMHTIYAVAEDTSGNYATSSINITVSNSAPVSATCPQSTAFLSRTSGLSANETSAYSNLICGMVSDGTWSLMDGLYIFATNNPTTANLNLVSTNYALTPHGTVAFAADHGYTGDAATGYLDTGITSGGNYSSASSASLGVYNLTSRTTVNNYVDIGRSVVGSSFDGCVSKFADTVSSVGFATAAIATATSTNSQGQWICTRTSPTAVVQYKDGNATPVISINQTATTAPTSSIYILGLDGGATPYFLSGDQLSAAFVGGALTPAQSASVASRINAYMTALGINVY
jgi:hypothetical protein